MMIGEVNLTERHLSSAWESAAVDGDNVSGYFRIYEGYYDRYFGKRKHFYYSGSIGYVKDEYNHLISNRDIENQTVTIGGAIGYRKENVFKIKHLYFHISIPFRYYFNDIPETKWDDTTIAAHKIVNNIWFFIGYHF